MGFLNLCVFYLGVGNCHFFAFKFMWFNISSFVVVAFGLVVSNYDIEMKLLSGDAAYIIHGKQSNAI